MQPQIFLSYSWKNKEIAEAIDNDWQAVGLTLIRDVRDVAFKQNLKQFMQRVHESDYVLLLISKDYLESKNCMYEALEVFENPDFRRKILPVITKDAQINDSLARLAYIDYWELKQQALNDALKRMAASPMKAANIIDDLRQLTKIGDSIDAFAHEIQSMLCATWPDTRAGGYAEIFNHIGYNRDETMILEECSRIMNLATEEEQELALDDLREKNADDYSIAFTESSIAYRAKKYKKSRKILEDTIRKYPDAYQSYHNLGVLISNFFNDKETARTHYEKAIELNPGYAAAHAALASVLNDDFQDYVGARRQYEAALAIDPDRATTQYNMAVLLSKQFREFDKAKVHFEKALALNPTDATTYYAYGVMYGRMKDYSTARRYHEKCLELNPEHVDNLNNLAITLASPPHEDYTGAQKYFEQALALDPNEQSALFNLALLIAQDGEDKDLPIARQYLETLLALDPENTAAQDLLGNLLRSQKDYPAARQHYEHLLVKDSQNADAHLRLGRILGTAFADYEGEKRHYELALKINPADAATHHNLGVVLRDKFQDYPGGRRCFERSIELDANQADSYNALAILLIQHFDDDLTVSTSYLEQAVALAPDNPEFHYNMALLLGDALPVKARYHYEEACKLNPTFQTTEQDKYFGRQIPS